MIVGNIKNKIKFTFDNYVNSRMRKQNTGTAKFGVKGLIYEVVTLTVFYPQTKETLLTLPTHYDFNSVYVCLAINRHRKN